MALTSTVHAFEIALSDVDRSVYESLSLRVARHPSETLDFLVTRVLAYCLEFGEGIAFSKGLSDPDEPALAIRDLTGALQVWIEVGFPDADRLHKAAKVARRVVVYTHKDPDSLVERLSERPIHRGDEVVIRAFERPFVTALVERLSKRTILDLSVTEGHLYATLDGASIEGTILERRLATS